MANVQLLVCLQKHRQAEMLLTIKDAHLDGLEFVQTTKLWCDLEQQMYHYLLLKGSEDMAIKIENALIAKFHWSPSVFVCPLNENIWAAFFATINSHP